MARTSKCTAALTQRLLDALSVGATHRLACEYAGIDQATLYRWLAKGAASGAPPYRAFCEAFTRAQGIAAVGWLAKIEAAAQDGDWRAAAWKLERRYPDEYGKQVHDVHHAFTGPLHVELTQYGDAPDPDSPGGLYV
jgi:transposase